MERKLVFIGIFIVTLFLILLAYYHRQTKAIDYEKKIAILKTAQHPALDQAEQGFLDVIEKNFDNQIFCDIKNADGSIVAMNTIADSFIQDDSIGLFYAIATPALQALTQKESERPIVFAAVTDPSVLNIGNKNNVCGVTDAVDATRQMDYVVRFVKNIQKISILYNTAELNSIHAAKQMKKEGESLGITVYEIGILQASDIGNALEQYIGKVDAIITPTDNLVASSISFIASFCKQHEIPLIVSDNLLLQYGALASCGVDYYQAGKRAGEMAISILNDEKTAEQIKFEQLPLETLQVNREIYEILKDKLLFDESYMTFLEKK